MSSSFHVPRRLPEVMLLLLAAVSVTATTVAQDRRASPGATSEAVALGEKLFNDKRLSSSGSMSCATCHRPDRSFTEDKAHTVGQTGASLGRNTPTLLGLASVNEFPVGGSLADPPRMVSLEERVVVPLRDHDEMSDTVGGAIDRLAKDPACVETFNAIFEDPEAENDPAGITGDRIAAALAAYVRSLRHVEAPGLLALAGAAVVLDGSTSRGLDLFRNEGRCQSCHSGPALTDGKLHVVSPHLSRIAQRVQAASMAAENAVVLDRVATDTRPRVDVPRSRRMVRGGSYGQSPSLERQTLTLLDVRRTAPYFRDGSAPALADAIRQHVVELRAIGAIRENFLKAPTVLKPGGGSPFSESAKAQLGCDDWVPPNLRSEQVNDLVSFLNSLSPMD